MAAYETKQGEMVVSTSTVPGAQIVVGDVVKVGASGETRIVASIRVIDGKCVVGLKKEVKAARPRQTLGQYRQYLASGQYDNDNGAY
jgi:hypothetical protein